MMNRHSIEYTFFIATRGLLSCFSHRLKPRDQLLESHAISRLIVGEPSLFWAFKWWSGLYGWSYVRERKKQKNSKCWCRDLKCKPPDRRAGTTTTRLWRPPVLEFFNFDKVNSQSNGNEQHLLIFNHYSRLIWVLWILKIIQILIHKMVLEYLKFQKNLH